MIKWLKNKYWWWSYSKYLKSKKWNKKRKKVFERDDYSCQHCHNTKNLECHHITYKRVKKESLSDLLTLCYKCHKEVHRKKIIKRF